MDIERLRDRIGEDHLSRRLRIQADHACDAFGTGRTLVHIENMPWVFWVLRMVLRPLLLYRRGQRNAADLKIRRNAFTLPNLPPAFEGFRILQLADLHYDTNTDFTDVLIDRLGIVDYDLCVITGDFRSLTIGPYHPCLEEMQRVRPHLKTPVYAILGNHDFIEMVDPLEAMDITVLLNESARIERDGEVLHLAGVDDVHFYECGDIEKVSRHLPPSDVSLLLCHSPEGYREAAQAGFDMMLAGHTHGGQVCLPGGIAPIMNAQCPRAYCKGPWRHGSLQGYTSVGSGSSGLDIRFNCPPEITIHELKRNLKPDT